MYETIKRIIQKYYLIKIVETKMEQAGKYQPNNPAGELITINRGIDVYMAKTLLHEFGHAMTHRIYNEFHTNTVKTTANEIIAECFALMVVDQQTAITHIQRAVRDIGALNELLIEEKSDKVLVDNTDIYSPEQMEGMAKCIAQTNVAKAITSALQS